MSKTQMSPKFRRASMIGAGFAVGAFAIAVPSIAWAVDTSPSEDAVVISAVAATGDQDAGLTHEEICAQAPVDLDSLTTEELATLDPAAELTEATVAQEGEAYEPTAEELANAVPATETTPATVAQEGEAPEAGGMTTAFSC